MIVIGSMMHKKYINQNGRKKMQFWIKNLIFKSLNQENINKIPKRIRTHDLRFTGKLYFNH